MNLLEDIKKESQNLRLKESSKKTTFGNQLFFVIDKLSDLEEVDFECGKKILFKLKQITKHFHNRSLEKVQSYLLEKIEKIKILIEQSLFIKLNELKKHTNEFLKEIEEQSKTASENTNEIKKQLKVSATLIQAGAHNETFETFRKKADDYLRNIKRYAILSSFIFCISFGLIVFYQGGGKLLFNILPITFILTTIGIYLVFLEKRARGRSFKYKDLSISITQFDHYLEGFIKDDNKDKARMMLVEKHFGSIHEEGGMKEKEAWNLISKVTETVKKS